MLSGIGFKVETYLIESKKQYEQLKCREQEESD